MHILNRNRTSILTIFINISRSIIDSNKFIVIHFFNLFHTVKCVINVSLRISFNFLSRTSITNLTKETLFYHCFTNFIATKIFFEHIKITCVHSTKSHLSNKLILKFITSSLLFILICKFYFVIFSRFINIFTSVDSIKKIFILFSIYCTSMNFTNTTLSFRKFIKLIPRKRLFRLFISIRFFISKFISYTSKLSTKTLKNNSTHYSPKSTIPKFRSLNILR